jgi:ABC-type multidrug transport system ATPase subunit
LIDVQGEITLHGYDVRRQGKRARGLIGYVAQDTVFDDLPLRELMAFYARLRRVPEARIDPLIARLGLAEHARKPVPALSGGLKQRLALGLALLSDPPLLVLDEPTASLDDASRREYLALLRSLLRTDNRTILFASHRLEEIEFLADRVLILEAGRLREEATLREFMARFGARLRMTIRLPEADHPRALALFQQSGWPAGRNGHGTVHVVLEQADKPRALQAILRAGLDILDVDFSAEPPWS